MLILFFIVGVGLFVSAILVYTKTHRGDENPYSYIGVVLGTLITLASFITIIIGSVYISKSRTIDIPVFPPIPAPIPEDKETSKTTGVSLIAP